MKVLKLQDICTDIFAGAAIFNNDNLSRDYKDDGYRVIRLADIQNNKLFKRIACFIITKITARIDIYCKIKIF
jgi:hypothetical protein